MNDTLLYQANMMQKARGQGTATGIVNAAAAAAAHRFHRQFANYAPTPLLYLPHLARKLGVAAVYVKNEAERFGLNAFKSLGGSYAIGRYLAQRLGRDINDLSFAELASPQVKVQLGDLTFITATDGNHGRGVAWAAEQLGMKAVVLMPHGSSPVRAENIRKYGADCTITDFNYDDTVREASRLAAANGWVLLQDTAWDGYEEIPTWIMQGYLTLAHEISAQLPAAPTHLILQAGVGSFAGAIAGYFVSTLADKPPTIIIAEPHQANCLYQSAVAADGKPHNVGGAMQTIMAGLACGEPNTISWPLLRDYAAAFISADDHLAANGMRIAAAPRPGTDPAFISGESSAIGLGLLYELKTRPQYQAICRDLALDDKARVLLISTEGDTSPDIYEAIVWQGWNQ